MPGMLRTIAVVAIAVVTTLFCVQNLAATEVAFLTWSVSAPRALVFALIFLSGLAMGALLVSLRPRRKSTTTPPRAVEAPIASSAAPGDSGE